MNGNVRLLKVERHENILVVVPRKDLGEENFQEIQHEAEEVYQLLQQEPALENVILDLHRIAYFGSTALGFFISLWKRISSRGGNMVLCHVSGQGLQIFQTCSLDKMWPICASREEAMEKARQGQ